MTRNTPTDIMFSFAGITTLAEEHIEASASLPSTIVPPSLREHPVAASRLQGEDPSADFARLTTPSNRAAIVFTESRTANEQRIALAPSEPKELVHGPALALDGRGGKLPEPAATSKHTPGQTEPAAGRYHRVATTPR